MLRTHVALFDDLKYDDIEEWLGHRPAITDSLPMLGQVSPTRKSIPHLAISTLVLRVGPSQAKFFQISSPKTRQTWI